MRFLAAFLLPFALPSINAQLTWKKFSLRPGDDFEATQFKKVTA